MKINVAHLKDRSTSGGWVHFAVFDAHSTNGDKAGALQMLTAAARNAGLKVEKSALAYMSGGRIEFYGDKDLVQYLANNFTGQWTHTIDV